LGIYSPADGLGYRIGGKAFDSSRGVV
jgi:hypothetical protein